MIEYKKMDINYPLGRNHCIGWTIVYSIVSIVGIAAMIWSLF